MAAFVIRAEQCRKGLKMGGGTWLSVKTDEIQSYADMKLDCLTLQCIGVLLTI